MPVGLSIGSQPTVFVIMALMFDSPVEVLRAWQLMRTILGSSYLKILRPADC